MNPAEDIFDVVNEHDEIIDQQPRSLVHSQGLRHRAAHVLVFNKADGSPTTLAAWEGGAMGMMSGSELRSGLEVALPAAPAVCSEVNATLKGWTPSACGSSTVIEYRAA